jgi:ribose transport system ATP-binding protein
VTRSTRLEVRALSKSFGTTAALAGVSLGVGEAEVHAVVGENGAGKSTLMAVLSGAVAPDAGSMTLDGAPFAPKTPAEAYDAGVAIVHQEPMLCAHLSVAENIGLGRETARFGVVSPRARDDHARRALAKIGARIDVDARTLDLSPADRQLVAIARAVGHERSRVLILDEPTSSLAADDAERLITLVRSLRDGGLTVLYVSHFLEEVRRVADRFTVLRDGKSVADGDIATTTTNDLVAKMAGRAVEQLYVHSARTPGDAILSLDSLAGARLPVSASLELRRGEVLGVAGLVGSGRTELLRAIFGLDPIARGTIRVAAATGARSPKARLAQGVGMLSEDRKGEGALLGMTIADNVTLSRAPLFSTPRAREADAQRFIAELSVRCSGPDQRVVELSGGNQQKVALARLLHKDVDVLLLDEPTRGIDIGSKAQIYAIVDRLACAGKAVLLVSSHLPELLGVCDRIAVMRRGQLGAARPAGEWTEHALIAEASGPS